MDMNITAPVVITASTELLEQMRDHWSQPVEIHLALTGHGWEMTLRTHTCETQPATQKVHRG